MSRTTLDLDDGVLRELKLRRDRERKPLGQIASELLAQALAVEFDQATAAPDLEWAARPMGAKVDLEDKDAVWAVLDER